MHPTIATAQPIAVRGAAGDHSDGCLRAKTSPQIMGVIGHLEVFGDPLFRECGLVCQQLAQRFGDLRLDGGAHERDGHTDLIRICERGGVALAGDGDIALEINWGALDIGGVAGGGFGCDRKHPLDLERLADHRPHGFRQQVHGHDFIQHCLCAGVGRGKGMHLARLGGQVRHVVRPVVRIGQRCEDFFGGVVDSDSSFNTRSHNQQTTVSTVNDSSLAARLAAIEGVTLDPDVTFAQLTTLHLGGTPRLAVRSTTVAAVANVVSLLDAAAVPALVVGGGSNLVVADGDVDVVAVILECDGVHVEPATGVVVAEAGAIWDDVVSMCVAAGLGGIECLSGIPGSAGATPVQNVGAYGVEVSDVLTRVRLWDRERGVDEWVPAEALDLAYRYSNLKFSGRAVVLAVELALYTDGLSAPLRFGELVRVLGAEAGDRVPAARVRNAVLELRRGKGMVYDPADVDTWSAGSFFTNPIVSAAQASKVRAVAEKLGKAESVPCFAVEGGWKLSAAWLIDHAGFTKGYPGDGAAARLSTKHTLALTNRGTASTADLVGLAREVRWGVEKVFGVSLEPEPVWVGVTM